MVWCNARAVHSVIGSGPVLAVEGAEHADSIMQKSLELRRGRVSCQ